MFLSNSILFLDSVFYQYCCLIFVVAGILVSIRFLNFPDLTVDGSFTIGACLYGLGLSLGYTPLFCLMLGFFGGLCSGSLTAIFNEKCHLGQILASVITMLAGIAVAPYILGGATLGLMQYPGLFAFFQNKDILLSQRLFPSLPLSLHPLEILILSLLGTIVLFIIYRFAKSNPGLLIRYHGSAHSPQVILGKSSFLIKLIALGLGNSLVAIGGIFEVQRRGSVDQNSGMGMILVALASLILGETILRLISRRAILSLFLQLLAVPIGTLAYCLIVQIAVFFLPTIIDIRLLTVGLLAIVLIISSRKFPRSLEMF